MAQINHWYLHVDLDAFFASVEQLDHPEYKGKPLIVGGLPENKRSVVSTASYEARKFGVHSAMPTYQAYKLCPQGIYVRGNMKRYSELSYQIMSIFREYSPDVDQMSIDEAFIDLTGTEKLFGPPEETAMKIKAHVKKNTGLTVSVGLATTKYLAKIASGFSKPDGFYFVKPGSEQQFMLDLPLNKVWGVGEKTLENLKKAGIRSTRDIYEKSYDALEFMFGKNTANFLYNVVRGIDTVGFGTEPKKHSISAESTFPYDITDTYTAETQLLDLCHCVSFRLLRSNSFSRTAHLKIRYDDFSTVSCQETFDHNILTVDDFFEKITALFERKYEKGRGIRLLGVGFDNVETQERPFQQSLFDDGKEKKQAVEKAIIKLEKKHPEIKVQKARTLNKNKFAFILLLSTLIFGKTAPKLYAKEINETTNKGAGVILPETQQQLSDSTALFNWEIDDTNNVEFLFSGFWKASLLTGLTYGFGEKADSFLSFSLPVFTQEIDLSTWILLNNTWYFQSDFADLFEKNTIAMGYLGKGYLKEARISNRDIKMSPDYSASLFGFALSGGNNQAPGISFHFEDQVYNRWHGDFLLRYDMTKTNSATFYGKNCVTDQKISPKDFVYGKIFILPQECNQLLNQLEAVYVENKNGQFKDSYGRKYKKLPQNQYIALITQGQLWLGNGAASGKNNGKIPTIIATFTEDLAVDSIIAASGSYADETTFLGKIQKYFNKYTQTPLNLQDYSGKTDVTIQNKKALVLQSSSSFSPYLCANIYDCGFISTGIVFVESASKEIQSREYYAEQFESDYSNIQNDFIYENHYYAQISNANTKDSSLQLPENRYPFGDTCPELYLNLSSSCDYVLVARSFSPVSQLQIGTEAIAGSVQVFINNQLDTGAKYNSELGTVEVSKTVSQLDKIYITWQEDASNYTGGAIAAGTGLFYNFSPNLYADIAITSRWPALLHGNYSTPGNLNAGFAAASGGINYSKENFTFADKAALSINTQTAAPSLLLTDHEYQVPQTFYFSNSDGYQTHITPILNILGAPILEEKNEISSQYYSGGLDDFITGYKIQLAWEYPVEALPNENYWASVDIKLNPECNLQNASSLELALEPTIKNIQNAQNLKVYLQLGVKASETFDGEISTEIPTWEITSTAQPNVTAPLDLTNNSWQTVIVTLSAKDRAKLTSNCDARIIVISQNISQTTFEQDFLCVGPYEPRTQSLFATASPAYLLDSYQTQAKKAPVAENLNLKENYYSHLNWKILDEQAADNDSTISTRTYFTQSGFNHFQYVKFGFGTEQDVSNFTFTLYDEKNEALKLIIPNLSATYSDQTNNQALSQLSIDLFAKKVFINDVELLSSEYSLTINNSYAPNTFALSFDCAQSGSFDIGNLYYSNAKSYYNAQNYIYAEYKKDGAILSHNDYAIIKDANFTVKSEQSPSEITANANAQVTITDITFQADYATTHTGGHSIKTAEPLFSALSLQEQYRFDKSTKASSKEDSLNVDLSNINLPLKLQVQSKAKDETLNQSQEALAQFDYSFKAGTTTFGTQTNAEISQKINNIKLLNTTDFENYFSELKDISQLQFSTGDKQASSRTQNYTLKLFANTQNNFFAPELNYKLGAIYQNIAGTGVNETSAIQIQLPFTFNSNTVAFNYSRTGLNAERASAGGNYSTDFNVIGHSYSNAAWFYTSIPFFELVDRNLPTHVLQTDGAESSEYNSLYEITWRRRLSNSLKDLFIPVSSSLGFSRDIKAGTVYSDLYQIKCSLTNTAINCFGQQSIKKLFQWYNQDEFISSLTAAMQLPALKMEKPTFTLSAYSQALFYIDKSNLLRSAIDFLITDTSDWTAKNTVVWERPGKSSFILDLVNALSDKETNCKLVRKEIFNFEIGTQESLLRINQEYTHSIDFNFTDYFTLTTGLGQTFNYSQNSAAYCGLNLSLGGKLEF